MELENFEPIFFHGRYALVELGKDHWGPFLKIKFSRSGTYRVLIKRIGNSDPLLHIRVRTIDPNKVIQVRLPARLNETSLKRIWMKIKKN